MSLFTKFNKHKHSYHPPIFLAKIGPRKVRILEDTIVFGTLIPKNYESNGISIPKFLWAFLSPFTEGFRAALVHDYGYSYHHKSRAEVDWEFFINLRKCGISFLKSFFAYIAVRVIGRSLW